jgi:hypothetical protein
MIFLVKLLTACCKQHKAVLTWLFLWGGTVSGRPPASCAYSRARQRPHQYPRLTRAAGSGVWQRDQSEEPRCLACAR